jgi:RNA polymerase sigma-70 factor (ECF subfamily)
MGSSKPDVQQEAEWIGRCQRGEREAFGPLVERYQRRVFSLVYHLVRRRDEAEDLAQEIFIKAFLAIRTYNFQAAFVTWLSRIAVNHCYDYLRRQRGARVSYYWQMSGDGQRDLEARLEGPLVGGVSAEQTASLRDLTGKLLARAPAKDRVILVLKEMEDMSVKEIGEILKLKTSTVKVRLHRARRRMLEDLDRLRKGR